MPDLHFEQGFHKHVISRKSSKKRITINTNNNNCNNTNFFLLGRAQGRNDVPIAVVGGCLNRCSSYFLYPSRHGLKQSCTKRNAKEDGSPCKGGAQENPAEQRRGAEATRNAPEAHAGARTPGAGKTGHGQEGQAYRCGGQDKHSELDPLA